MFIPEMPNAYVKVFWNHIFFRKGKTIGPSSFHIPLPQIILGAKINWSFPMGLCSLFLILSFLSSSAFADPEKEKIFSLLANLPKVTTAKIRRGNTEIPIDLSQPSAKSQIQDYDVILLEEGVYS